VSHTATHEEVTALLTSLRLPSHDVAGEIADMLREAKGDADNKEEVTWTELFANKQAVVIGCGLLFFQAMTGINSVTFYSTTIFGLAGFTPPIAGTVLWTFINFAITLVSAYLVDKVGRKVLLTGGTYLMLGSLVALSVVLISDMDSAVQGGLCVLFVLLYVIGFAIGLGAVVWVIMSEIMSTRLRVKATSMFLSINWVFNILISFLTLTAINSLGGQESGQSDDEIEASQKQGVAYLYFIFAGLTLLCLAFIHLCVPETKKE
jgi:MFS family permease